MSHSQYSIPIQHQTGVKVSSPVCSRVIERADSAQGATVGMCQAGVDVYSDVSCHSYKLLWLLVVMSLLSIGWMAFTIQILSILYLASCLHFSTALSIPITASISKLWILWLWQIVSYLCQKWPRCPAMSGVLWASGYNQLTVQS